MRVSPGKASWLTRSGLRGATFATRAEAMRAYTAAAAIEAPETVGDDRVRAMREDRRRRL